MNISSTCRTVPVSKSAIDTASAPAARPGRRSTRARLVPKGSQTLLGRLLQLLLLGLLVHCLQVLLRVLLHLSLVLLVLRVLLHPLLLPVRVLLHPLLLPVLLLPLLLRVRVHPLLLRVLLAQKVQMSP